MTRADNTRFLTQATAGRHQETLRKASDAIAHLDSSGQPVNFSAVAAAALLTELPSVAAAQEVGRPRGRSLGCPKHPNFRAVARHVASLIAMETGHRVLNHLPSFSSLPIFDIGRGGPQTPMQLP